jgi:hypothetical protein
MVTSKLAQRFALSGIVIGFTVMGLYWYDYRYNPFHLPPPPPIYSFLEKAMFVLCPGLLLQVFTIGTSDRFAWAMWTLAVLLNGPVYYLAGLVFVAVMNGGSRSPAR